MYKKAARVYQRLTTRRVVKPPKRQIRRKKPTKRRGVPLPKEAVAKKTEATPPISGQITPQPQQPAQAQPQASRKSHLGAPTKRRDVSLPKKAVAKKNKARKADPVEQSSATTDLHTAQELLVAAGLLRHSRIGKYCPWLRSRARCRSADRLTGSSWRSLRSLFTGSCWTSPKTDGSLVRGPGN